MTQLSYPWTCAPVGDGQSYSVEMVEMTSMFLGNHRHDESGVLYWQDNTPLPGFTFKSDGMLKPSYSGSNNMKINSGVAMVKGWFFIHDNQNLLFNVAGGNANAIDIIGLRLDVAGQTVRLFHGRGGVSTQYNLVQTSAIWEVALARVTLDGSGNYSSFLDVRYFTDTGRKLIYDNLTDGLGLNPSGLETRPFSKLQISYTAQQSGGAGTSGIRMTINSDTGNNYYDAAAVATPGVEFLSAIHTGRYISILYELHLTDIAFMHIWYRARTSISTGFDIGTNENWQWNRYGADVDTLNFQQYGSTPQTGERLLIYGMGG